MREEIDSNTVAAMGAFAVGGLLLLFAFSFMAWGMLVQGPRNVERMQADCARAGMDYASGYKRPSCMNPAGQIFNLDAVRANLEARKP